MSIRRAVAGVTVAAGLVAVGTGCETKSFLDPSEMGRYEKTPKVVPILDKLVIGTENDDVLFPSAREVSDADLKATANDYRVGPGDVLQVTIQDLAGVGLQQVEQKVVSESGKISLPYVGQLAVTGQTEAEVEQTIINAYAEAKILPKAVVSVTVVQSQNRIYTVTGAVSRQGPNPLTRSDFRLLDAIANAGGLTSELGVDYLYIVRRKSTGATTGSPAATPTAPAARPAAPGTDPLAPQSRSATPTNIVAGKPIYAMISMQATAPAARSAEEARMQAAQLADELSGASSSTTRPTGPSSVNDRVIQIEGAGTRPAANPTDASAPRANTIPPTAGVSATTAQPPISDSTPFTGPSDTSAAAGATSQPFEFTAPAEPTDVEVIKVPYPALRDGSLKYNIVIKPGDLIVVPQPGIGEYYMGGHVARTGVYSLTARKITLKQAVISAGMLDQLAVPARTDIIRRTGANQEAFVRVDLERIFNGLEPDVYLKPNDQVMVGTNAGAPFLAALRNAFRITYGFGFLYDRNFSPDRNNNN